jgi:hypothetical protein
MPSSGVSEDSHKSLKKKKELKKLDNDKLNNPMKKWGTDLNRESSTEEPKMVEKQRNIQHL